MNFCALKLTNDRLERQVQALATYTIQAKLCDDIDSFVLINSYFSNVLQGDDVKVYVAVMMHLKQPLIKKYTFDMTGDLIHCSSSTKLC